MVEPWHCTGVSGFNGSSILFMDAFRYPDHRLHGWGVTACVSLRSNPGDCRLILALLHSWHGLHSTLLMEASPPALQRSPSNNNHHECHIQLPVTYLSSHSSPLILVSETFAVVQCLYRVILVLSLFPANFLQLRAPQQHTF